MGLVIVSLPLKCFLVVQIISILTQRNFDLANKMFQSLLGSSCLKDSNKFF